jgi:hypothetical protein
MFGDQKNLNKNTSTQDPTNFISGYENAPIHTMQDDIDALAGKAPSELIDTRINIATDNSVKQKAIPRQPFSTPKTTDASKAYSPFLNSSTDPETPTQENNSPSQPVEITQEVYPKKGLKWNKILMASTFLVAILALAAGGYFFWITRKPTPTPPSEIQITPPEQPPVVVEPPIQKYSSTNPNYLSIDTRTITSKSIQDKLIEVGSEIRDLAISSPVEFLITDENNNPIDLQIFSIHAGLKLEPVLDLIGNEFSLYIYNDAGNTRVALAIDVKDKPKAITALKTKERTLVNDLSFLVLDNKVPKTNLLFKDGSRNNRYVNLDTDGLGTLSIDYAFTDKQLVIGTSKNTTWSVLEKINQPATTEVAH